MFTSSTDYILPLLSGRSAAVDEGKQDSDEKMDESPRAGKYGRFCNRTRLRMNAQNLLAHLARLAQLGHANVADFQASSSTRV